MTKKSIKKKFEKIGKKYPKLPEVIVGVLAFGISFVAFFYIIRFILANQLKNF